MGAARFVFVLGFALGFAPACAVGDGDDRGGLSTFGGSATFGTQGYSTGDGDGDDTGEGDGDGSSSSSDGDGDGDGQTCGNGQLDTGEVCDGNALGGESCTSLGYTGGALGCAADCSDYDLGGCINELCGNAVIDDGELCDGPELNGQSCASIGFAGGNLGCGANCLTFDVSGCYEAICGNGVIEQGEVCDGNALGGQNCVTQGYAGGTLLCNGSCTGYNTANCVQDSGDCCTSNPYAGCQDANIVVCVCGIDSYCCTDLWDIYCVDEAIQFCGAIC